MSRVIEPFKLRMKVLDVEIDGVRRQHLCASFHMNPATGEGVAFLMSEEGTMECPLHIDQWNKLPFVFFSTDGEEAPRPPKRWLPGDPPPPRTVS
jgi:hypothetical protein